jgi:hypothetical protein
LLTGTGSLLGEANSGAQQCTAVLWDVLVSNFFEDIKQKYSPSKSSDDFCRPSEGCCFKEIFEASYKNLYALAAWEGNDLTIIFTSL